MQLFVITNNVGIMINVCGKGFIWNLSNCECECNKLCDIGEYLDYKIWECRKN